MSIPSTRNVSNVTTAIFFENIRRYCTDVQRFLSSASSPNFGRIEDRATDGEKQQPRNEKAEGKAGGMAEYSSRTKLQWPVAWTSKRTLIQELRYNANIELSSYVRTDIQSTHTNAVNASFAEYTRVFTKTIAKIIYASLTIYILEVRILLCIYTKNLFYVEKITD